MITTTRTVDYNVLYNDVVEYLQTHDSLGNDNQSPEYQGAVLEAYTDEDEKEQNPKISSLEELFSYMPLLRKIKPTLTRLPLDEEPFFVDSNTRAITIPSNFSKNGLSVQGDEIAESVYFKIDRFLDHVDLATQSIYIQYENADGEQGAAVPALVDLDSEPGYIIFEWAISSRVTKKAGNVKFSVRFYTYNVDEEKIQYSFSSLPFTLQIKASQDFDVKNIKESHISVEDNNKDLMEKRLIEGPLYESDGKTVAELPVFYPNYKLPETINLALDQDGFRTLPVTLNVEAYSVDSGQVSYYFEKNAVEGEYKREYIETKDTTPVATKLYYTQIVEDGIATGYKLVGKLSSFAEGIVYYERTCACTIDEVGKYVAYATNRVKNATATESTPAKAQDEDGNEILSYCVVPEAVMPVVAKLKDRDYLVPEEQKYEATANVTATATDDGKFTYQWYFSKDGESFEAIEDATSDVYTVIDEAEVYDWAVDDVLVTNISKSQEIKDAFNALSDSEQERVNKQIEVAYSGLYFKENNAFYAPKLDSDGLATGDGWYMVKVTNNINKTSKTEDSTVERITHKAVMPTIVQATGVEGNISLRDAKETGLTISVAIPECAGENRASEDEIQYQWYAYVQNTDAEFKKDKDNANLGLYVVDGDTPITGATTNTLKVTDDMKSTVFFCKVTNKYNNNTASRCSAFFTVVSIDALANN